MTGASGKRKERSSRRSRAVPPGSSAEGTASGEVEARKSGPERRGKRWRTTRTDETSASLAAVMDVLVAPDTWPRWQPEIMETSGPEQVSEGAIVTGRAKMIGFHVYGHSTTVGIEDGYLLEDVLVGVRMKVRYSVTERSNGTTAVTHDLTLFPLGGPAGRLLGLLLRRRLKTMQKTALLGLIAQAEVASD